MGDPLPPPPMPRPDNRPRPANPPGPKGPPRESAEEFHARQQAITGRVLAAAPPIPPAARDVIATLFAPVYREHMRRKTRAA